MTLTKGLFHGRHLGLLLGGETSKLLHLALMFGRLLFEEGDLVAQGIEGRGRRGGGGLSPLSRGGVCDLLLAHILALLYRINSLSSASGAGRLFPCWGRGLLGRPGPGRGTGWGAGRGRGSRAAPGAPAAARPAWDPPSIRVAATATAKVRQATVSCSPRQF